MLINIDDGMYGSRTVDTKGQRELDVGRLAGAGDQCDSRSGTQHVIEAVRSPK